MNKKRYLIPEITIIEIQSDDIISCSSPFTPSDPNMTEILDKPDPFNVF